jgi:hypothetical protein
MSSSTENTQASSLVFVFSEVPSEQYRVGLFLRNYYDVIVTPYPQGAQWLITTSNHTPASITDLFFPPFIFTLPQWVDRYVPKRRHAHGHTPTLFVWPPMDISQTHDASLLLTLISRFPVVTDPEYAEHLVLLSSQVALPAHLQRRFPVSQRLTMSELMDRVPLWSASQITYASLSPSQDRERRDLTTGRSQGSTPRASSARHGSSRGHKTRARPHKSAQVYFATIHETHPYTVPNATENNHVSAEDREPRSVQQKTNAQESSRESDSTVDDPTAEMTSTVSTTTSMATASNSETSVMRTVQTAPNTKVQQASRTMPVAVRPGAARMRPPAPVPTKVPAPPPSKATDKPTAKKTDVSRPAVFNHLSKYSAAPGQSHAAGSGSGHGMGHTGVSSMSSMDASNTTSSDTDTTASSYTTIANVTLEPTVDGAIIDRREYIASILKQKLEEAKNAAANNAVNNAGTTNATANATPTTPTTPTSATSATNP